jgi:hypothetical protein
MFPSAAVGRRGPPPCSQERALRVAMRLPRGTAVVRIAVFRERVAFTVTR